MSWRRSWNSSYCVNAEGSVSQGQDLRSALPEFLFPAIVMPEAADKGHHMHRYWLSGLQDDA
jgi:hypothetical protein